MRDILPEKLVDLAKICPKPLYVVGGSVRDFLAGLTSAKSDLDISSPMSAEVFLAAATAKGFTPAAVYSHTGTVKLKDSDGVDYEYTCFRSDKYVRGTHVPVETFFTENMTLDAKRRDFTANAVYYDIAADRFVDPLGGIDDIKNKTLRTVDDSDKVFGEDGLRLMRLARQAGQLGFSPNAECLSGAKKNASLIRDISPERIWAELVSLLHADKKYGIADGHYRGLKLLDETGVLDVILPELALGRGMAQRADFHNYDVLEHTFHAVLYADERVRLSALLHDVAKPFCVKRDGNSFAHPTEGARMAEEILTRFKAPKHTTATVKELVLYHMYDFDGQTKENKLRRFFVVHRPVLEELLLLKQADFSGCKDDLSPCPTGIKWRKLLDKMRVEGAPTSLKELAITGKEVAEADDMQPKYIADVLRELLLHAALEPQDNTKERLLAFIPSALHEVLAREAKERKL